MVSKPCEVIEVLRQIPQNALQLFAFKESLPRILFLRKRLDMRHLFKELFALRQTQSSTWEI